MKRTLELPTHTYNEDEGGVVVVAVPDARPIMAFLCDEGVGADIAQHVCFHGLVSLNATTGETWWAMQYVSTHWKRAWDRAWKNRERSVKSELDELLAEMQVAYDTFKPSVRFVLPARIRAFSPRDKHAYLEMHMYRPVLLKYATLRFPATVPLPDMQAAINGISCEWASAVLCDDVVDIERPIVEQLGSLSAHSALAIAVRIMSISMRCSETTFATLLFMSDLPTRESVPFLLLFALLGSLKNRHCTIMNRFFDPVALLAGYDKVHTGRKPPIECLRWANWPECEKACNKPLFMV